MANEFTNPTKAAIFARDRATCCFSGANLWLLDSPLRTGWQADWADHIKPRSKGGTAAAANGVCASHTFNSKKRNNTADTTYLFRNGHPTYLYYDLFGTPPPEAVQRLKRLASLEIQDWYFNRALKDIFSAFEEKCWKNGYTRTPRYWFTAAFNRLLDYQKFHAKDASLSSLEQRGIVIRATPAQKILLSLRRVESLATMKRNVLQLHPSYREDSRIWWEYFFSEGEKHRRKAYTAAERRQSSISSEVWKTIQADFAVRHPGT